MRALIIEDRGDFSAIASYYLRTILGPSISVTIISSGEEFSKVITKAKKWDLVITDGHIGELQAEEVINKIRLTSGANVPIMLMTTDNQMLSDVLGMTFTYSGIEMISKPCSQGEFQSRLLRIIHFKDKNKKH